MGAEGELGMDEELLASVLKESSGARLKEGCRVGMMLNQMRDEKPQVFETFQHLLERKDAAHSAIAKALNDVAKTMVVGEYEVPLSTNGSTVARHRGNVTNPCKCREVYEWMTN